MQGSKGCLTGPARRRGSLFIATVLTLMAFEYVCFVLVAAEPWKNEPWMTSLQVVFHILFAMMLWAFYQCATTDPGMVPANWGFYMGDETKRRRYCKMCNVWKPDRTHHCSICNRCVLNMDHHCPWINNCVGFHNRKFFMQLIFYVYACLLISTTSGFAWMTKAAMDLANASSHLGGSHVVVFLATLASLVLIIPLTNFTKFHVELVGDNFTTIENLERETKAKKSRYDIGWRRNWEQVFGPNPLLWFVPWHTVSSRPAGDGVRWRVHYTRVMDEDEDRGGSPAPAAASP